jgi:hypothetical protein
MQSKELNLPQCISFLFCQRVRQDVLSKNYDVNGVFQGFQPPGYPFGAEFMTFCRLRYEGTGQFKIETTLSDEMGGKISDSDARNLVFNEAPMLDLFTGWRVVFPKPGAYIFRLFCNNLALDEYKLICR